MKNSYSIAIYGASTPLGKVLKEALPRTNLRDCKVKLLDSEKMDGTLTEYNGGADIIRQLTIDALEHTDLLFNCESSDENDLLDKMFSTNKTAAETYVIDLAGKAGLDSKHTELPSMNDELELPEHVFALPHSLSIGLTRIIGLIQALAKIESAHAVVMVPVSELGQKGIEGLHTQMVELMNFGELDYSVFPSQIIFNVIPGFGKTSTSGTTDFETSITRQVNDFLADKIDELLVSTVLYPTFYSYTINLTLDFAADIDSNRIASVFDNAEGFSSSLPKDGIKQITPLDTTDSDQIHLLRIQQDEENRKRLSLWLSFDNYLATLVNESIIAAKKYFENLKD